MPSRITVLGAAAGAAAPFTAPFTAAATGLVRACGICFEKNDISLSPWGSACHACELRLEPPLGPLPGCGKRIADLGYGLEGLAPAAHGRNGEALVERLADGAIVVGDGEVDRAPECLLDLLHPRPQEPRVGKECVITFRSRC